MNKYDQLVSEVATLSRQLRDGPDMKKARKIVARIERIEDEVIESALARFNEDVSRRVGEIDKAEESE